jgi:hypothetical protein
MKLMLSASACQSAVPTRSVVRPQEDDEENVDNHGVADVAPASGGISHRSDSSKRFLPTLFWPDH